ALAHTQMPQIELFETQRRPSRGSHSAFQGTLQIKEIQFSLGFGTICFQGSAVSNQCQRFSFARQLFFHVNAKNQANFKDSDVSLTVIQVVAEHRQQSRNERSSHS